MPSQELEHRSNWHTVSSVEEMSAKEQVELENFGSIFDLEGKVAVVTGGSRGLGLHAASG